MLLSIRPTGDNRRITLLCFVGVKLRAEPLRRLAGFCEHHHPANGTVEPMHEAKICLAGLAVVRTQIRL